MSVYLAIYIYLSMCIHIYIYILCIYCSMYSLCAYIHVSIVREREIERERSYMNHQVMLSQTKTCSKQLIQAV